MNKPKVLLTGGAGMLGKTLFDQFAIDNQFEVQTTDYEDMDITNSDSIDNYLNNFEPDFLINCAAYTDVNGAEDNPELANKINALGPDLLAKATKDRNIGFIHISTDYVFGENLKEGYDESTQFQTEALNQYGKSKRKGEQMARESNLETRIVRVSWTYGPHRRNFVDVMLELAKTKDELSIVDDEFGVPTYTKNVSDSLIQMLKDFESTEPGIYHAVSEGFCSRFEEAEFIFKTAGIDIKLTRIKLADYPRKAVVPNYSILHNTKLPKLPTWQEAIEEYLADKKVNPSS
ncbi:dTDP-4-dehydrorhamnose reductase [Candidatus Dojkabacteria bacterium]|uniref:dTDP-4-dehydrorhamnose reductase n=1 Tax=Candidatus Dojkabacteria bacterium TaxID=2099670 RepID=A0A955L3K5_9BACT|nr:dTDP-4-dehydrorhamnose reductase [Candidatus Dojkabacteria bacterium]